MSRQHGARLCWYSFYCAVGAARRSQPAKYTTATPASIATCRFIRAECTPKRDGESPRRS